METTRRSTLGRLERSSEYNRQIPKEPDSRWNAWGGEVWSLLVAIGVTNEGYREAIDVVEVGK